MSIAPTAQLRRLPGISLGGAWPIWLLSLTLLASGAALWGGVLRHMAPPPAAGVDTPWWALALVFYLVEAYVVHVHFRREAHTISLNEVGLVAGLFLLTPGSLLLAQLVGGGAALAFHRRQRPVKLMFNLGQLTLTTAVAVLVFRAVCDLGSPFGPAGWGAAIGASVLASLLGIVLVAFAIKIVQGEWGIRQLPATAAISVAATLAVSSLTLVAIELGRIDPLALALVLVPGAIVVAAFRALMEQRRQREHLEFLYESMQRTQRAPEFGLAVRQLLIAVRRLARAEYAEILLFPTDSDQGLRSTLSSRGEVLMQPGEITAADRLPLAFAHDGTQTFLLPKAQPEQPLDDCLRVRDLPDGMIAILRGDNGPFGLLIVGDRSSDVDTFKQEDAILLETFAGHASVLIENGRLERSLAEVTGLKEKLSHQAYHDTLTGLGNRALFAEHLEATLRDAEDGSSSAAILFLDIDDFKAINDSMGHAIGDELLAEVGRRVRACTRAGELPARLGGDEFAVLLEQTTAEGAQRVAEQLLESLAKPVKIGGRDTYVHASIGIAPATSAATADELLRNADVAMYAAKDAGRNRYSHYQPVMHALVRKRHELALDLERAVERGEIHVVFQPILSLRTGRVVSAEALARWYHPERGHVPPLDFIPIAEQIGLMPTIGQHALQGACRAARTWQEAHSDYADIGLNVNLSPSELVNERLADGVARTLLESRLDPKSLTLEITETSAITHVDSAAERMHELRALGVKLALDDFGTGHSSLERLHELPLTTLKIPKLFIDRLLGSSTDPNLIDAFVRLADSLDLDCVAEGIEHAIQVTRLLDRGCGLGQGFYLGRPMTSDKILGFLDTMRLLSPGA
jgi:diguanylate cyclase (GGDEF)-like protein